MIDATLKDAEVRMQKAINVTTEELSHIRTGKATTALLDSIKVEAYGQLTPLNQVASVSAPEVRLLTIQPWDKSVIKDIEKAILASDIGLNPNSDGQIIRLAIPQLTEERRKEMVKLVKKYGEDGKVAVRNIRRDANDHLKKAEKSHEIREDECYRALEEIQNATDKKVAKIDEIVKHKEDELMQV